MACYVLLPYFIYAVVVKRYLVEILEPWSSLGPNVMWEPSNIRGDGRRASSAALNQDQLP
jgi:hypothetical protein